MSTENVKNNSTRGELKLLGAVEAFRFDFRGKTVLDIGSSTGGFTEVALKKGAEKVIAVEKGTNQMKAPLRYDPRIELRGIGTNGWYQEAADWAATENLMEGTNLTVDPKVNCPRGAVVTFLFRELCK